MKTHATQVQPHKVHQLKTWPMYFTALRQGSKTFELRENDRQFKVGDTLQLREFDPCVRCWGTGREWDNGDKIECFCTLTRTPKGRYTGHVLWYTVTYVLAKHAGLVEGYVILGIKLLQLRSRKPT